MSFDTSTLFLLFIFTSLAIQNCSYQETLDKTDATYAIPISLNLQTPSNIKVSNSVLNLENILLDQNQSLELAPTVATNLVVSVSGCSTGYTLNSFQINSGVVNLYRNDHNCLVKLMNFNVGSITYSAIGGTPFSTWLTNDYATYKDTASSNTISVFVKQQVTQSGVLSTDLIKYTFTDLAAGTTSNFSRASVGIPVPLSVSGEPTPNFSLVQARYLSTNADGSGNLSFTLQCGNVLTGSSLSTYACSSILLNSQLDYVFGKDPASQGVMTEFQARSMFLNNTATPVGNLIVAPNGQDLDANVLTNGGFYTSNSSPLVTGTTPIIPNGLDNVFVLRSQDTHGNIYGYLYFYVEIPAITATSGCSSVFSSGAGTIGSPYLIATQTDLANIALCDANNPNIYFQQVRNISLTGSWNNFDFYWNYEGSGYLISNLSLAVANTTYNAGLFSSIQSGAKVSDLNLSNFTITSNGLNSGALAGLVNGSVTNVSASGSITGTYSEGNNGNAYLGGLIGQLGTGGSVTVSSSSVTVVGNEASNTGSVYSIGGLIGKISGGTVYGSSESGAVSVGLVNTSSQTIQMGALAGSLSSGSVTATYTTGAVSFPSGGTNTTVQVGLIGNISSSTGTALFRSGSQGAYTVSSGSSVAVGGIVGAYTGTSGGGTISNVYTMASVQVTGAGAGSVGGFVGSASTSGISQGYTANMTLTSNITPHAFYGNIGNTCTNCYYYASAGIPSDSSTGVGSLNASQMAVLSNFTNFSSSYWVTPSANLAITGVKNPVLGFQCGTNGITCTITCNSQANYISATGNGSSGSPYLVSTASEFQNTSSCNATYFLLANDIDFNGVGSPFNSTNFYNGNNYAIKNLQHPLFNTFTGTLSNTNFSSTNISGSGNISGGIAITLSGAALMTNVHVLSGTIQYSKSVSASRGIGYLVGTMSSGTLNNCSVNGTMNLTWAATGNTFYGGGLVAEMIPATGNTATISNSYSSGSINFVTATNNGTTPVGGIVGFAGGSGNHVISNTYSTMNITYPTGTSTGTVYMGGIVGQYTPISGDQLSGLFTSGTYYDGGSRAHIGGIIGDYGANALSGIITNSYTMGAINILFAGSGSSGPVGGFIGGSGNTGVATSYSSIYSLSYPSVGYLGFYGNSTSANAGGSYLYTYGGTIAGAGFSSGLTTYSTSSQMIDHINSFTNFTFTSPGSSTGWSWPSVNPFAPNGVLSPVLSYQCNTNGIVCP